MRWVFHVFRKDVRRLWWAVTVSLVLLGALAQQDRWRSDTLSGSTEGWLNLIVPFAWACLIGLAVEQDPMVGDRQFWITRPHRRASLLAAKLLFAVVFVHGGSFLADCYILAARGFSPVSWLPQLLQQQMILAAALTLPALALAALFRNFTQFMLAMLCAAGLIVIVTGNYNRPNYARVPTNPERVLLVVVLVCVAAAGILLLQYLRRKTLGARAVAAAVAALSAAAYSWLPATTLWAARARAEAPSRALSATVETGSMTHPFGRIGAPIDRVTILLPIRISGVPAGQRYRIEQLGLDVGGPGGELHRWNPDAPFTFERPELNSFMLFSGDDPEINWMALQMNSRLFARLKQSPVTIRGTEGLTLSRVGTPVTVPLIGTSKIPGGARCTGTVREDSWNQTRVKFECESPAEFPRYVRVTANVPGHSPPWSQTLGDSNTMVPYVHQTWLSPLDRRQTSFNVTYPYRGGGLMPFTPSAEDLAHSWVTVTPESVTGYSVVRFELRNARLEDYLYRPGKIPGLGR